MKSCQNTPVPMWEGLISLFEHDRAHYSKMIATLLPILGMLTGGALAELLSPDPTDINDNRVCTQTTTLIEQQKVMYFGLDSLSDPMVGKIHWTAVAGRSFGSGRRSLQLLITRS